MGDSAIYLLGATSDDGLNAKGAYLLQWTLIQWLKENGIQVVRPGGHRSRRQPGRLFTSREDCPAPTCLQLTPLVACNSVVSSAIVRASLAAYSAQFRCICTGALELSAVGKHASKQKLSSSVISSTSHGYLGCHRRLECQALFGTVPGEPGSSAATPQHGNHCG